VKVEPGGTHLITIRKPVVITWIDIVIVGTALTLMLLLELLVFHTRLGTAMRAVSYNFDNSGLMGIPVDRIISVTFVTGATLAAAAGFLYAMRYQQIQQPAHQTWVLLGLKAFVAAVVGGIGNVRGALVGGFLIAFIEQFSGVYFSRWFHWDNARGVHRCVRLRLADHRAVGEAERAVRFRRAGEGVMPTTAPAPAPAEPRTLSYEIAQTQTDVQRGLVRAVMPVVIVVAIAALMHRVIGPWVGNYQVRIMLDTGVAIIAAVSLNIVNGYTGQFSIGHAAFMAIGGYVAGFITYYGSLRIWGDYAARPGIAHLQEWMFAGACIVGGLFAAAAGWWWDCRRCGSAAITSRS
jgi:ABC-type branched-subunit amino acid transport system permease subunit